MASATEPMHAGEFASCIEEDSNDSVVVLSGQTLVAGDVVGLVNIAGIGRVNVPTVVATASANGTCSLVTVGPLAQVGSYVLTCTAAVTHGGVWTLVAPDGTTVGTYTMTPGAGGTTAFTSPHLNWSLTDGSTDFAAGDVFTFVVGTTAPAVVTAGSSDGTIGSLSVGKKAQRGNYKITNIFTVTNGGYWQVQAPDGSVVAVQTITAGAGGTAVITSEHINATITDGSTDFAKGDYFNVAVYGPAAAPKAAQWDPTATDGRQNVAGIAWDAVDASAADTKGVITVRKAVVKGDLLSFKSTLQAGDKAYGKVKITALGVTVR